MIHSIIKCMNWGIVVVCILSVLAKWMWPLRVIECYDWFCVQNDSLSTMMARIEGILGPFPPYMLEEGR